MKQVSAGIRVQRPVVAVGALAALLLAMSASSSPEGVSMAGRFGLITPGGVRYWVVQEGVGAALVQSSRPFSGAGYGPLGGAACIADVLVLGGLRLLNAAGHLAAALLLFLALRAVTRAPWKSALTAALFAAHPLTVQAVLTLEALPMVMGAAFAFAALWATAALRGPKRAIGVSLLTACAVLSSPLFVLWPLVLRAAAHWRRAQPEEPGAGGRFYLPLLAGAMVLSALYAPQLENLGQALIGERVIGVLLPAMRFAQRAFLPLNLGPLYTPDPPQAGQYISLVIVLGALAWSLYEWRRLAFWRLGWAWYFAALTPACLAVLGGATGEVNWLAYAALPGLLLIGVWGVEALAQRWKLPRQALAALAGLLLVVSLGIGRTEAAYWASRSAFYERAIATSPHSPETQAGYGVMLAQQGRYEEALDYLVAGTLAEPDAWQPYAALGKTYMAAGQYNAAVKAFREAIHRDPTVPDLHKQVGLAYLALQRWADVETTLLPVFGAEPTDPEVCIALAKAIAKQGRLAEARRFAQRAQDLAPGNAEAEELLESLPPAE